MKYLIFNSLNPPESVANFELHKNFLEECIKIATKNVFNSIYGSGWNGERLEDYYHSSFEKLYDVNIDLFVILLPGAKVKVCERKTEKYKDKIVQNMLEFYGKIRKIINEGEK